MPPAHDCLQSAHFFRSLFLTAFASPFTREKQVKVNRRPSNTENSESRLRRSASPRSLLPTPKCYTQKGVSDVTVFHFYTSPRGSLTPVIFFVSLCRRRNPRRKPVLKIFDSSSPPHKRQTQDVLFFSQSSHDGWLAKNLTSNCKGK